MSVLPPSSRRKRVSSSEAKALREPETGAKLSMLTSFPPNVIEKLEKSPAAGVEPKVTPVKVAVVGTCATYLAPKSASAFKAFAIAAVVNSVEAATGTEMVLGLVVPKVTLTESVVLRAVVLKA